MAEGNAGMFDTLGMESQEIGIVCDDNTPLLPGEREVLLIGRSDEVGI